MSNELFTEHRVKITKCFRVSDALVPSKVCRLFTHLAIGLGHTYTISYFLQSASPKLEKKNKRNQIRMQHMHK